MMNSSVSFPAREGNIAARLCPPRLSVSLPALAPQRPHPHSKLGVIICVFVVFSLLIRVGGEGEGMVQQTVASGGRQSARGRV